MTIMLDLPHVDIPRDRWGRPTIEGRTYTRVSTLAKTLDDTRALQLAEQTVTDTQAFVDAVEGLAC